MLFGDESISNNLYFGLLKMLAALQILSLADKPRLSFCKVYLIK